jgi:uncharacterized membrane protein YkoI
MYRYLTQYYIAENSLTSYNGAIFDLEADFFGELDAWELKYEEDHTVYDFEEKDCTSEELKEKDRSSVHVTAI